MDRPCCHPPHKRLCLLSWVHQPPAWGSEPRPDQPTVFWHWEHSSECLAWVYQQHQFWCWWTHAGTNWQSACADWWDKGWALWHEEVHKNCRGSTHQRAQLSQGPWARAQGPQELFANASMLPPTTMVTAGPSAAPMWVVNIKVQVLVIVGERWMCVISRCGTRSQLRYVIILRELRSKICSVQYCVQSMSWDFQFNLVMCQSINGISVTVVEGLKWMVQCRSCGFAGECSVGSGATKLLSIAGKSN